MNQPEPCRHWWLLGDLADLPRDQGRCKLCGLTKPFPGVYVEVNYTALDRPDLSAGERDIVNYMAGQRRRET